MRAEFEKQLRERGIRDVKVLAAMDRVAREEFVPELLRDQAYRDNPLLIGDGQTISQPYIVALMTEALGLRGGERVLEIGTGSGYQAAVLAELGCEVFSVETIGSLSRQAGKVLRELGYSGVHLRVGDGSLGWPREAPFDAVIVTCAAETVPDSLFAQLGFRGRMVIPVGSDGGRQVLWLYEKSADGEVAGRQMCDVIFVPLVVN
jgi:protein-L-isoaspartate(D-aspartate) O-methyltransferase